MIASIASTLKRFAPGLLTGESLSVICIRMTRPKYLVFRPGDTQPAFVMQFGTGPDLERLHGILGRLHAKLPDAVAKPLAFGAWRGDFHVEVQSGLPGTPWLRFGERFRSARAWIEFRSHAGELLNRLHTATRDYSDWLLHVNPARELRRQWDRCRTAGVSFSRRVADVVESNSVHLAELGELTCPLQHGDFCINNLLVSADSLAVVDFDEFGRTAMPLHDEFSLMLSFRDPLRQWAVHPPLGDELQGCLKSSPYVAHIEPHHVPGLFLHHLLWRINQSAGIPTRDWARNWLEALVEKYAANATD